MKRIRKPLILLFAIMLSGFSNAQAKDREHSGRYVWNVELDAGTTLSRTFIASVLTSHGYSLDTGLYLGVGTGLTINPYDSGNFVMPLFADVKYRFVNNSVCSPYLSMKIGSTFYMEDVTAGLLLKPAIGVDIKNYSLHLEYGLYTGVEVTGILQRNEFTKHSLTVGVSRWF